MATAETKWVTEERRLAAAYDGIAAGRLKSASSLVERHLKKHPASQPALVLRVVLLERIGSPEQEVLKSWESVKKTGDLTTRSAWFIGTTFRNLGRRDLTLQIYQNQWANQPDSVELGEQVFLHAAAAWDQDAMVESSRKMFNKLKAPVWARVAAWSEWVHNSPQPISQDSFTSSNSNALRVASTLLSLARKNCESADILWLHLQILISAGSLSDALALAQSAGAEGSLARLWYRMEGVNEILARMKQKGEDTTAAWTAEWEWAKGRLQDPECERNYAFYRHFLFTTEQLLSKSSTVSDTRNHLEALHAEIGEKERAPRLAVLELDEVLAKSHHASAMPDEQWTDMAEAYWSRWGSKGSVVTELEGIVSGNAAKQAALEQLLGKIEGTHSSLDEYRRVVNKEMLLLRGKPESWTADDTYIRGLSKLYVDGSQYGRNLPRTDVQPADDVGLALVHILVIEWSRSPNDEKPLLRAILLLRYILDHSPACKSAPLLLCRLLRLAGAASLPECTVGTAAKEWSEIQIDNLSHFSHDRAGVEAYVYGTDDGWEKYQAAASKMYRRTATDMPDYIKQALRHESYSKIPGIRTVASTLQYSTSRYLMAVERARLELISGKLLSSTTSSALQEVVGSAKDLVDTRDWSLMPDLGPKRGNLGGALALGDETSSELIRAWAGVLLRCEGIEVEGKIGEVKFSTLLPAERNTLPIAMILADKVNAVFQPNTASGNNDTSSESIEGQLSELIAAVKSALSATTPLWHRLYHFFLVIELKSLIRRIRTRLEVASKPAGKKGSKPIPTVAELLKEIERVQETLRAGVEGLLPGLEALRTAVSKDDWESICVLDELPDGESLIAYGMSVTEARIRGIDSIKKHLTS